MRLSEIAGNAEKSNRFPSVKKGCPEVSAPAADTANPEGLGSSEEPHEHAPHATEATRCNRATLQRAHKKFAFQA